jgi:FkbM family methyltransferase
MSEHEYSQERVRLEESCAKKEVSLLRHRLQHLPPESRARLQESIAQTLLADTLPVETPAGALSFVLLGPAAGGRALKMLTKQPDTIEWIDGFGPDSVFWDIGANIGTYALYAARCGTRVVAFEPAAINYFLLAANCEVNGLDRQVDCLLLGLGEQQAVERMQVSQFAGAQSFSFRQKADGGYPGRQAAVVMSMDHLIEEYGLPCPNYIKIDVPGRSVAVLAGGARTLRRADVREVHMELREESKSGQRVVAMLVESGFTLSRRSTHGGSKDVTFTRTPRTGLPL